MVEPNTGYYAEVVADSINPLDIRLVTLEVCFPRFILAEFNTHRVFSRNSASSRAIPVVKQLERIEKYPFVPEAFPINKPGMSATEYLLPGDDGYAKALSCWLSGRDRAVETARELLDLDIHKQTANRVLEPYMWHTVVLTATELMNFFNLRISKNAQPEIQKIASMMKTAIDDSDPTFVPWNGQHLPYVDTDDLYALADQFIFPEDLLKISSGRCAAVTLLNHQGKNREKDISRTEKLVSDGHMSPLEHPAVATPKSRYTSNFHNSWLQYRKMIPGEDVYKGDGDAG